MVGSSLCVFWINSNWFHRVVPRSFSIITISLYLPVFPPGKGMRCPFESVMISWLKPYVGDRVLINYGVSSLKASHFLIPCHPGEESNECISSPLHWEGKMMCRGIWSMGPCLGRQENKPWDAVTKFDRSSCIKSQSTRNDVSWSYVYMAERVAPEDKSEALEVQSEKAKRENHLHR